MALLDPVSVPTKGTALYIGSSLIGGASGLTGFGSGAANKIDITTLASNRQITRKGLLEEGSVTIDGILAQQSDSAAELEAALQNDGGYSFTIRAGGNIGADGLATGNGRVQRSGIAFTAIAAGGSANEYDISLGSAKQLPAIVEGDYVKIGAVATLHRVDEVAINASGNGVLTVSSASSLTTGTAGTISLIRPAISYAFTGTVDSFTRDLATNEVMRYSLTIGSIASIETTLTATLPA